MQIARGRRGLGASLVECAPLTLLLPCAVADGWRVWPLLAIWIGGYAVRRRHEDRQLTTDCAVSGILYAWLARENLIATASKSWNIWMSWIRSAERTSLIYAVSSVALPLTILAFFLWRTFVSSKNTTATPLDISRWRSQIETPKPKIFPCQTTHARIFPKRHGFAYSYLQCGFPIVSSGTKYNGIEFPSGEDRTLGRWWLRVRAEDYLERGGGAEDVPESPTCRRFRMGICLLGDGTTLLRLRIQPSLVLVCLRSRA